MTTYVDSSALIKRYVEEPDSEYAEALLRSDDVLATSWLTVVEVRRNLARLFSGLSLTRARDAAHADLDAMALIQLDEQAGWASADIAETLGVRTLDAVHLAAAQRLRIPNLSFITFDLRQGNAARLLGFRVLGC